MTARGPAPAMGTGPGPPRRVRQALPAAARACGSHHAQRLHLLCVQSVTFNSQDRLLFQLSLDPTATWFCRRGAYQRWGLDSTSPERPSFPGPLQKGPSGTAAITATPRDMRESSPLHLWPLVSPRPCSDEERLVQTEGMGRCRGH